MGIEQQCGIAYLLRNSVDPGGGDGASHRECLELRDVRGSEESGHDKRARAAVESRNIRVGNVTQKQDVVAKAALLDELLNDRKSVSLLETDKHEADIGVRFPHSSQRGNQRAVILVRVELRGIEEILRRQ